MKKRSLVVFALVVVMALTFALAGCGKIELNLPNTDIKTIEYAENATLKSVTLPEGYTWKNPDTVINVGKNDYDVIYTKDDTTVTLKVTVVMKEKPVAEVAPVITLEVGEVLNGTTLASVKLPKEYSWVKADTVILDGTKAYDVNYIKGDKTLSGKANVVAVVKDLAPVKNSVKGVYADGSTLASVELPEGYAWADANAPLLEGVNDYDAVYREGALSVPCKASVSALFDSKVKAIKIAEVAKAEGKTLESIALPEGAIWADKTTKLVEGRRLYAAKYTLGKEVFDIEVPVTYGTSVDFETSSIAYIENLLKGADYQKGGKSYADVTYDQYVMILAGSTVKEIDPAIKSAYLARVKDVVLPKVDKVTNLAIDGEGWAAKNYTMNTVLTLLLLDEPTTIDGVDLLAPFYNKAYMMAATNDLYFYINAIRIMNLMGGIPSNYTTADGVVHISDMTIEMAINKILSMQSPDGAFRTADWTTGKQIIDYDATSMALTTLANTSMMSKRHYDKLVLMATVLVQNIGANGGIIAWGSENPTTTATTMQALAASYIDSKLIANGTLGSDSLYDFMASNRKEDGSYSDAFTTKDGIIAIISYNKMLAGDSFFGPVFN